MPLSLPRLALISTLLVSPLWLSGCELFEEDPEYEAAVDSVTTALPHEIAGCTFKGDIDVEAWSVYSARRQAKYEAWQRGANHIVETYTVMQGNSWIRYDPNVLHSSDPDTVYLTARAYDCPQGKGILNNASPQQQYYYPQQQTVVQQQQVQSSSGSMSQSQSQSQYYYYR